MQKGAWASRASTVGLILIVASVACSGSQPSPASDLADADAGVTSATSPQNCALETRADGSLAQRVVVTTDRGKLVIENDESESADGKIAVEMVLHVEVGGQVFMDEKTTASSDKHARSHAVYGPLVQGIHEVESWTDDDDTLHETVDGRPMEPVSLEDAKDDPSKVPYRFVDGAPAPATVVDPQVQAAVAELFEKGHASSAACSAGTTSQPGSRELSVMDSNPSGSYDGNPGQIDDPQASGACIACRSACVGAAIVLAQAIPKLCSLLAGIPFVGPALVAACIIVGEIGVVIGEIACEEGCLNGGSCCPQRCGPRCCDSGDGCLNNGSGLCCPHGQFACPNAKVCCNDGDQCMGDGTGCCGAQDDLCPPGARFPSCCNKENGFKCLFASPDASGQTCTQCNNTVCRGVCCNAGQACAAGQCCSDVSACNIGTDNETCCADPTPICTTPRVGPRPLPGQGQCCTIKQACNGNTNCCADGLSCTHPDSNPQDDFCCPDRSNCGNFCCNGGPTANVCGRDGESLAPTCCGADTICNDECCDAAAGQTCQNLGTSNDPVYHCCAADEVCRAADGDGPAVCCLKSSRYPVCAQFPTPHCVAP